MSSGLNKARETGQSCDRLHLRSLHKFAALCRILPHRAAFSHLMGPTQDLSSRPRQPAVLGQEAVDGFLETRLPVFMARLRPAPQPAKRYKKVLPVAPQPRTTHRADAATRVGGCNWFFWHAPVLSFRARPPWRPSREISPCEHRNSNDHGEISRLASLARNDRLFWPARNFGHTQGRPNAYNFIDTPRPLFIIALV